MKNLNPQLASFFIALEQNEVPPFDIGTVDQPNIAAMRQWYLNFGPQVGGEVKPMHDVFDTYADARDQTSIPLRVYKPSAQKKAPAVIYFHGGGWVMGDLNSHDKVCRNIAAITQSAVIAVDYSLAPEVPYPTPVFDAIDAVNWIFSHHSELDVDPENIALAGDSAGGNLAAAVALALRDEQQYLPICQILIYPSLDLNTAKHSSAHSFNQNAFNPPLTAKQMSGMMNIYLQNIKKAEEWMASPIKAKSHENLPPALILTASLDPLRDDGIKYAELLSKSGVDVLHRNYAGLVHGFFEMAGVLDTVQDSLNLIADWVTLFQRK